MAVLKKRDNGSAHSEATVDRLFADLQTSFPEFPFVPRSLMATHPVDVYEEDGKYVIELAIPGYSTDEIDVEINGNVLTVSGEQTDEGERHHVKYHRREIRRSFTRTILLPQDINSDTAVAEVENGILTIEAAPLKPSSAKKIEVVEA